MCELPPFPPRPSVTPKIGGEMPEALARPEQFFADRFGLNSSKLDQLLGRTLKGRVDDGDLYFEYRISEELLLEESSLKKASRHVSQGAGVRAQAEERTGYAYTDEISITNLEEAAKQARAITDGHSQSGVVAVRPLGAPHDLYRVSGPPVTRPVPEKGEL